MPDNPNVVAPNYAIWSIAMLECLEITEDRVKPSGPLPRADVAETVEALYLQAQEYRELMEQALASIKVDREKVQAALDAATRESFEAWQKGEDAERMRLAARPRII